MSGRGGSRRGDLHGPGFIDAVMCRVDKAIDEGTPAEVLTAALYERFASRGEAELQNKLLSAMRCAFGAHLEKPAK